MKFLTASMLLPLLAATATAKYCLGPQSTCNPGVGKSRLIASIPGFKDSYSSIKCAQVDCSRTCRRSLDACRVLCGGDEDLLRCAIGVSPPPKNHHSIPHTIPTNYTTAHLSMNTTHPATRIARTTRLPQMDHSILIPYCAPFNCTEACNPPWNYPLESGGPRSALCANKCNSDANLPLCPAGMSITYSPLSPPNLPLLHLEHACAPVGVDCSQVCRYGEDTWNDEKCFFYCNRELAHPTCEAQDTTEDMPTVDRPAIQKPTKD